MFTQGRIELFRPAIDATSTRSDSFHPAGEPFGEGVCDRGLHPDQVEALTGVPPEVVEAEFFGDAFLLRPVDQFPAIGLQVLEFVPVEERFPERRPWDVSLAEQIQSREARLQRVETDQRQRRGCEVHEPGERRQDTGVGAARRPEKQRHADHLVEHRVTVTVAPVVP
jgi:hypothetical protein